MFVRGCPQRSMAGSFIYNLMMDEMLGELSLVVTHGLLTWIISCLVEGSSRFELELQSTDHVSIVNG